MLLLQLEAPFFPLLVDVGLGVGANGVEDGEGDDDDDDSTEDNEAGGGGNEIDVAEGPTSQNFCANCSPVNSSCGQLPVKQETMFCMNPALSQDQIRRQPPMRTTGTKRKE